MAYPLRHFDEHDTWFITSRCFQARMLMTPHVAQVREVTGGVLARAAEKHGVQLYAFAFLSNHFHLVIHAKGSVIADFMQFLRVNLSKKLAPLVKGGWEGHFWERRYSAEPILDEPALERSVGYVLAHGVKEGLVARAVQWEGLHCAAQFVDQQSRSFPWYDWTRRWNARRSGGQSDGSRWSPKYARQVSLTLKPLPRWESLTCEARRNRAARLLSRVESAHAQKAVLGMRAVRAQTPARPREFKRTARPLCHATSKAAKAWYRARYFSFRDAFRAASCRWRAGQTRVEFPSGSFKPGIRCPVRNI